MFSVYDGEDFKSVFKGEFFQISSVRRRYKCATVDVFQFEEQSLIIKRSLVGSFLKQKILLSKEIL